MFKLNRALIFILGIIIGTFLASLNTKPPLKQIHPINNYSLSYKKWFRKLNITRKLLPLEHLRYNRTNRKDFMLESDYLFNKIEILCIILAKNMKNVPAIKATWGKSCNNISVVDLSSKTKIPMKKTIENSTWVKLCRVLNQTLHQWVLIAHDQSFFILENLRVILAPRDHRKGIYLGHGVQFWNFLYNSGKAGYVLSYGAIDKLRKEFKDCTADVKYLNQEDLYLGKRLNELKIFPEDTRDEFGLSIFHSYNWQMEFFPGFDYYQHTIHPVKCCSKRSVSFKATDGDKMYMYYYLLYQLQIYRGGYLGNAPAPTPWPPDTVWKKFLSEQGIVNDNISPSQYYKVWEKVIGNLAEIMKLRTDV